MQGRRSGSDTVMVEDTCEFLSLALKHRGTDLIYKNIQIIRSKLYLSYRFLFDRELISIVEQCPSPNRLVMWIAMLPDVSPHLAVPAMIQTLATIFDIPAEEGGEPEALIQIRYHLERLFEFGMESYPHLFEDFFSDSLRSERYFIGCDVHTEISLLCLRHIVKCISEQVLDDGLPYAVAWHRGSLRRHLHSLNLLRHFSSHLSRSSPSSVALAELLRGFSSDSLHRLMELDDGVDFGHFNDHLPIDDMQKSITQYLLVSLLSQLYHLYSTCLFLLAKRAIL